MEKWPPRKEKPSLLEAYDISTRLFMFFKNSLKVETIDDLVRYSYTDITTHPHWQHAYTRELNTFLAEQVHIILKK
ncbi:MAG: hypothetical protein LRY41_02855 [Candidatus Pacebacteria bacterium]|nr:hypothetical protein [Candidatus Paceibacterota bacterium]MCD8508396.1 hypothetical protein [Candidatus Paceibacterota bacterium]MCD8528237.1 hypothetical protein [Candidatus Paceibacterota bacterium]MCD8563711.1 hypothetical protein [Candidatus Paceibacterota bacterium]